MSLRITQERKILRYMFLNKGRKGKWFYAYHFNSPNLALSSQYFVGYEASARMSDLKRKYGELFEVKNDGKYRVMRVDFNNLEKNLKKIRREEDREFIKTLI